MGLRRGDVVIVGSENEILYGCLGIVVGVPDSVRAYVCVGLATYVIEGDRLEKIDHMDDEPPALQLDEELRALAYEDEKGKTEEFLKELGYEPKGKMKDGNVWHHSYDGGIAPKILVRKDGRMSFVSGSGRPFRSLFKRRDFTAEVSILGESRVMQTAFLPYSRRLCLKDID